MNKIKFAPGDKITLNTGYLCDTGTFVGYEGNKVEWKDEDGKIYKSDISKYNITILENIYTSAVQSDFKTIFKAYGKPFTSGRDLWDWLENNCIVVLKDKS